MKYLTTLTAILVLGVLPFAGAKDPDNASQEEKSIHQGAKAFAAAFNRGDAEAVAAFFAPDGELIDDEGQTFRGRDAIRKEYQTLFATNKGMKLEITIDSIRFVGSDVAIENGSSVVKRPGSPAAKGTYTAVNVKEGGKWLIKSVRENVAAPPPSHQERLADLSWMIGNWIDEDDNAAIHTSCDWTANRSFITRSFSVAIKGRIHLQGTEVIGWDPAAGTIRSWIFDSDGGFGEATWSRKGNRWHVKAHGTLQDGRKASAVHTYTVVSDRKFVWESSGRELDGELLPNIEPVEVFRKVTQE